MLKNLRFAIMIKRSGIDSLYKLLLCVMQFFIKDFIKFYLCFSFNPRNVPAVLEPDKSKAL